MNIVTLFNAAQRTVDVLPEPAGRAIFATVGTVTGLLPLKGTKQLRKNQARIRPGMNRIGALRLSAKGMRSYMRYYYEAFRLHRLTNEQIVARVQESHTENVRAHFASGKSATAALMHVANWDLAGTWSNLALAPVHTIAEKLDPPELFEGFLKFREGLGMKIYPLVKGGGALHSLAADMAHGTIFTPIIADRDLSATGIEVTLCGHAMMVAPGPALLAQRTGVPLYPAVVYYERIHGERRKRAGSSWGLHIYIGDPVYAKTTPASPAHERAADLKRMSQEWLDAITPFLLAHPEDWHMLQKVFVADLDPVRLARSRARAKAALAEDHSSEHYEGELPGTPPGGAACA